MTTMTIMESDAAEMAFMLERAFEETAFLRTVAMEASSVDQSRQLVRTTLERLHVLLQTEGTAVWMNELDRPPSLRTIGSLPRCVRDVPGLLGELGCHDWSGPFISNHVPSRFGDALPGVRELLVVALSGGAGYLVACNTAGEREFGSEDYSLAAPVATLLGAHIRNAFLFREQERMLMSFVESMVRTLDARDPYTRGHSQRVGLVAGQLGRQLGLDDESCMNLHVTGLLHDIGKIGVSDSVLRKRQALTDDEFEEIKRHPIVGYEILRGIAKFEPTLGGVRHHHENWDGTGYPDRLAGAEIPFDARIVAVADSFDAMWSSRPYREGMPMDRIEAILREGVGTQWDPWVVDAWFAARGDILDLIGDREPRAASTEAPSL